MYSKICRGKRNNSSTKNEPVGLSHFAQRRPSSSQLKSSFNNGKESLQFLIYLIGDEAYADMRLYPAFCKVKHRTHFQSSFWNTECTSHHPKSMILGIVVKAGQDRVSGNLQKHSFSPISAVFHWKDCRIEIKALLLQQQIPPRLFSMRTRAELLLFIHYGLYKTTVGLSPDSSNAERTGADCQGWDWSLAPVKNHKLLPFGKLYASDGGG